MDTEREELTGQLRHDLGKYVAFQLRWLPADPSDGALAEALAADLLHTRRGPDGNESAVELWARYRPRIAKLAGSEPFVDALDRQLGRVGELAGALASGTCSRGELDELATLAHAIADGVRRLHRHSRGED